MNKDIKVGDTLSFEVVKHVTLPQLKLDETGEPNFFTFNTVIEKGKDLQEGRTRRPAGQSAEDAAKATQMEAPDLAEVTDLRTGELGMLIVNSVLKSNLTEKYPGDGYVGKSFQIKKFKPVAGKRYFTFEILEIRLKAQTPAAADTTAKTTAKK